jgi:hypothetical protein
MLHRRGPLVRGPRAWEVVDDRQAVGRTEADGRHGDRANRETDGPSTAHIGDGRTVEEWTVNDAVSMLEQVALLGE